MAEIEDRFAPPSFEAEYTLESPLKCPHCKETINSGARHQREAVRGTVEWRGLAVSFPTAIIAVGGGDA